MSLASLIIATMVGLSILCFVVWYASRPNPDSEQVAKRLTAYASPLGADQASSDSAIRDAVGAIGDALGPVFDRSSRSGSLADDLQKADIKMKASEWFLLEVGLAFIVSALVTIRFSSIAPAVLLPFIFAGTAVAVVVGAGFYLRIRQRRRTRAFENQLGETIILLSNALKAGLSFAQSMATVAKNATPPMSEEFGRATREIALGISVDDALNHMVDRNRSEDFDLMVTAVQIQRVVGGNLAEILDTIAFTIRERVRITGEIRTLTAQARISGWIISLLPIGLAAFLLLTQPGYFGPMVKDPAGLWMLGIGLFSIGVGWVIIQRIVNIEV